MSRSNYVLKYAAMSAGKIPVSKYRSRETGITVCLVEHPTVCGAHICLATEAFDNDGLPHAVEHLVFHGGSEDYPDKGILDLSEIYGYTETTYTAYMIKMSLEGLLKLLPIYMDHLLYPKLTESGYSKEVHNINASGEDGGTMYREMHARENTGDSRMNRALLRAMYPGQCGYKNEAGGMLQNLRESTSFDKVKRYHEMFYRPENVCLIISGSVKPDDVFAALEPVEKKIMEQSRTEFCRPWQNPVPALTESVKQTIYYPSDDEKFGMCHIGFRADTTSLYEKLSLDILTDYLDATAVSPVRRELVEKKHLARSSYFYPIEYGVYIKFEKADVENIEDLETALMDVLTKISEGQENIDMSRMATTIEKRKEPYQNLAACNPTEELIYHFIYGKDDENDFSGRLNTVEFCDKMKSEPVEYWLNLLKQYFINTPRVVIIGLPSVTERAEEENTRRAPHPDQTNINCILGIQLIPTPIAGLLELFFRLKDFANDLWK